MKILKFSLPPMLNLKMSLYGGCFTSVVRCYSILCSNQAFLD